MADIRSTLTAVAVIGAVAIGGAGIQTLSSGASVVDGGHAVAPRFGDAIVPTADGASPAPVDRRRTFHDCLEDLRRLPDGGLPVPPPPPTYADGGLIPPAPLAPIQAIYPDGGTGNPLRDRIRALQQRRAAASTGN